MNQSSMPENADGHKQKRVYPSLTICILVWHTKVPSGCTEIPCSKVHILKGTHCITWTRRPYYKMSDLFVLTSLVAQTVKHLAYNAGDLGSIPGLGRSSGEGNGNPLQWKIPWTEEHGGLQSMGSQRVRHDWATSLSLTSAISVNTFKNGITVCHYFTRPCELRFG